MDTEILRPNAPGAEENINHWSGCAAPNQYQCVNEEIADEDDTRLYTNNETYLRSLWNIADHVVGSGTISSVKVYARAKGHAAGVNQASLKICIRSDTTVTEDTARTLTTSYVTYSKQWDKNPADGEDWEWADIDALQIGAALRRGHTSGYNSYFTQIYVEVNYTPAPPAFIGSRGFIIG